MTNLTPLSPAAQAVLDAYGDFEPANVDAMAAALRAVADQGSQINVPFNVIDEWEKIKGTCASFYAAAEWGYKQALNDQRAIAAELEGVS